MIPVLFKEDEQIFSHNGIGALYESLSCDVIEEENGAFTMELEYPVDGEWFSEIKDFRIIQAKPNDIDDPHNFRIYEIEKSIDELTVFVRANTRTNDLGNNLITNYTGVDVTPQQAMNGIKSNLIEYTNFDLISDIQTKSNVEWTRINPLNAIVGVRGSMVDIWGGQIKRTNTAIHLYSRRGRDNVVTIRPGKNIEGLNMTVSTAGLVTKILPTFTYRPVDVPKYQMVTNSDGTKEKRRVQTSGSTTLRDDITVLGTTVSSQYIDNYPIKYWSSVDYGDDDELKNTVDEYIDTRLTYAEESPGIVDMSGFDQELKDFVKTELDKRAAQYFTHRNPGVDKPTVRITVNMLQLSDSPDWEEFKDLERIGLTDTLDVWVDEYDIDVEVRVTTLTYDSIGEQVTNFNAGSDRAPRQSAIEKKYDDLTKTTNDYITSFKNGVQNILRNTADGLNRKFEGYTEPPAEISSEGDIWFKEIGEGKVEIWIHDGVYWQPLMTEDFVEQLVMDIAATQEELEEAKQQAISDTEQALEDAKAHAEAEDARIRGELELEVGGAIELAEQAKADAIGKANQALEDAKEHAEAEDARIRAELESDISGAISLAEQAKQDAIDKANQALEDAKAHADAEIVLIESHFDGIIEGVESDVADAKQTADAAVYAINNDIANKFTSLDTEILSIETISNSAQANAQTALNQSLDALGDASTALTNAQTALNRADTAIGDISDINVEIDDINSSLSLKANSSVVDTISQTVNDHSLAIDANAQGLALKANTTTVNALTGRVTTAETGITANATAIGLKADTTTVNALTGTVNTLSARVDVTAGQISSKVWNTDIQTAVDGIEVGGRNLVEGSSDEWMSSYVGIWQNVYTDRMLYTDKGIEKGSYVTLRIYLKVPKGERYSVSSRINVYRDDNSYNNVKGNNIEPGEEGYSEVTWRLPNSGEYTSIAVAFDRTGAGNNDSVDFEFKEMKLEKGNKATDWTPAPEDTTALINHVETTLTQKHDTIEATVSSVRTDLTGTTTLLNTTKATVDGHTSSISTLRTDVNGKATTAQFNTLNSTVNGTIQRVGTAEGKITTIETNVSGLQTTVAGKADKTQITQLNNTIVLKADKTALSSKKDEYTTTITINGNGNTYYPLYFIKGTQSIPRVIRISRNYNDTAPGSIWNPSQPTHPGGLNMEWVGNFGGWGGASYQEAITSFGETYTTMLADLGREHSSQAYAFFLRGGGAKYIVSSDQPLDLKVGYSTNDTIWSSTTSTWKSAAPKTSVNRERIDGLVTAQNSQITVLNDAINLRVTKNDVVNQINVSTEGILIDGKKVHITGTTTIDNGVIKNAHIGDLNASKINAGTINAARLNAPAIVTAGLTANVVKSTHIETSTATIDKIFATDAMVNRLTAKTAFISSVQAVNISAARITSGTIAAARLNASAIVTAGLTANVVTSTHIATSTATIDKLFATDVMITRLTAKTAFINNIKAINIDAARITSGTINAARLNASAIVTAGLTANVVKSTHISGDTALFDKLFSTSSATDRLSARSAWIKTANIADLSITNAKIANTTIASAKIAALDVAKLSGNITNFMRTQWNSATGGGVSIDGSGINAYGEINGTIKMNNGLMHIYDHQNSYKGNIGASYHSSGGTMHRGIAINMRHNNPFAIVRSIDSTNSNTDRILYIPPLSREIHLYGTLVFPATQSIYTNGTQFMRLHADSTSIYKDLNMGANRITNVQRITFGASAGTSTGRIASNGNNLNVGANSETHLGRYSGDTFDSILVITSGGSRLMKQLNANGQNLNNVGTINYSSDARLKENITERTEDDLMTIMAIDYKNYDMIDGNKNQRGFIAQQLQLIDSDLVNENDGYLNYNAQGYVHTIGHALQQLALRELNTNEVASQALQATETNEEKIRRLEQRIEELESAA